MLLRSPSKESIDDILRNLLQEQCVFVADFAEIGIGITDRRLAIKRRKNYAGGEIGAFQFWVTTVEKFVQDHLGAAPIGFFEGETCC